MSTSQSIPYPLRMSEELRAQVNALAKANNRSVNTELVLLLQEAISGRQGGAIGAASEIDVDALADALAERLAAKLKTTGIG